LHIPIFTATQSDKKNCLIEQVICVLNYGHSPTGVEGKEMQGKEEEKEQASSAEAGKEAKKQSSQSRSNNLCIPVCLGCFVVLSQTN
jgi:hypothetical protein